MANNPQPYEFETAFSSRSRNVLQIATGKRQPMLLDIAKLSMQKVGSIRGGGESALGEIARVLALHNAKSRFKWDYKRAREVVRSVKKSGDGPLWMRKIQALR